MFVVRLAGMNIAIQNKYEYIENMCAHYIVNGTPDFFVSASDFEIIEEGKDREYNKGYLESLAVYRKIANKIVEYNGFLLHGVLIEAKNTGIVFLAKSGVGKSTHARLWQKLYGKEVAVINGDKPLVRIKNNKVFAYGTPWAGKENLHINKEIQLKKVCFIERSEYNECLLLDKNEVFKRLIFQIYKPENKDLFLKTITLINDFIDNADFYVIKCNTDISAAKIACEGIML